MSVKEKEKRRKDILDKQFEIAMNGSVEMLKWLGIQYAGQQNKPTELENEIPTGQNIRRYTDFELEMLSREQQSDYLEWKEQYKEKEIPPIQERVQELNKDKGDSN
jgi:hypothetical protein|tara:strand:+ start:71 stop:388 length:318 start_codon:yes stop_codon:yes gene_type:complete